MLREYLWIMKRPYRYVIYLVIGFLIYQIIDSGETSVTYDDARTALIIGLIVVFILLLIVRVIKKRYED